MIPERVRYWIGERLVTDHQIAPGVWVEESYEVTEFLGTGGESAVFRVTGNGPDLVVKFPKNDFAFTVNLPPDKLFPRFRNDRVYEDKLMKRLAALEGAPVLSGVSPLDGLWTALAVRHLKGHDSSVPALRLVDFQALASCDFVRGRLEEWSLMDVGRSSKELRSIVNIFQGYEQIHVDLPERIAQNAKRALAEMRSFQPNIDSVQHNPLLPWIAAAASLYSIPGRSAEHIGKSLSQSTDLEATLRQAAQVFSFTLQPGSRSRFPFVFVILKAIGSCELPTTDLQGLFLKEVERGDGV